MTPSRALTLILSLFPALAPLAGLAGESADPPRTWQGLELTPSKTLDALYVKPGTSLKEYRRVMIDPVEVEFRKNWTNDPRSVTSADRERIRRELAELARNVFQKELQEKGGYEIVDEQAPDVLRVRAGLVDLYITAPDTMTAGRTRTYIVSAGEMTLVAELRDSDSGGLLALALDRRAARGTGMMQWSSKATNAAEASEMLKVWARQLRKALDSSRTM